MEIKYRNVYYQSNIYTNVIGVFRTDILHTLDSIPVAGSHSFTDGQEVVEGKDYEKRYEYLIGETWMPVVPLMYDSMNEPKRIVAIPLESPTSTPTAHTEELSREGRSTDKELIQFLISSDKPFKIIEVRNIINEYDREEISLSRFAEKLNEIAFYWNKKEMEHCFNESRLQFKNDNSFCHETFNDYLIYKNKQNG